MRRLMLINKPETGYIILGSIGAIISGAVHPAFGIAISKAIAVILYFLRTEISISIWNLSNLKKGFFKM